MLFPSRKKWLEMASTAISSHLGVPWRAGGAPMVTGASFSAQQEPPAPWAGGSCCTFTAREVFFPRRSPGKNVIGICSQRSCEFGETGGEPTLRAQSRLRATCIAGVGCGGLRGRFSAVGAALCGGELRWVRSFLPVYAGACARRDWGLGLYILIFGGDLGAF